MERRLHIRKHSFAISRRMRPKFCRSFRPKKIRGRREDRMRAAPAVSCAKCASRKRTRAYRFSGGNPAFPAQWLYGLCRALPGDEFVLVTVIGGLRFVSPGRARKNLRRFGISNGCQDHTVLPYASAPFVFAPDNRSQDKPALRSLARRRCRVHRIPSRVRDDRDTPLLTGETGEFVGVICPTR
jgi:hypothetical protein